MTTALADSLSESLVLSCLLRSPAEVGGLCVEAGVSSDWFTDTGNQVLYRHLLGIWSEGKPMERYAIAISLQQSGLLEDAGGTERIQSLFALSAVTSAAASYIEAIKQCYRRRRLLEASKAAFMDCQGTEPIAKIELALSAFLNHSEQPLEISTPKQLNLAVMDKADGEGVITTGFNAIDRFCGPVYRGDFLVIGGKRKMGKSMLAGNIASGIAKNGWVVFFSAEMDKKEIWKRMLCADAGVASKFWKPGYLHNQSDEIAMRGTITRSQELKIAIIDTIMDIDQAVSICRSLKAKYGELRAIVFDYLQLFSAASSAKASRSELVSSVSRACKRAALQLNTLVVGVSQLNDDGLSLDSRGIERDCNLMLNIDEDKQVFVAANRNGPQGVGLRLEAQLEKCRFIETSGN